MGNPRARLGLGIGVMMDCYIRLSICSALNTCVVRLLYIIRRVCPATQSQDIRFTPANFSSTTELHVAEQQLFHR